MNANIHKGRSSYVTRGLEKAIKDASRTFPAVIVTGPRQSGKTTLLTHLFSRSHTYVSMDEPSLRRMAREEPRLFFQNYPPPLIIDEIQYAPEVLSSVKILIDRDRRRNGQFLLTGSQIFPLMSGVSESLAGRMAVFSLLGFSFREQAALVGKNITLAEIQQRAVRGSFPEVLMKARLNCRLWFSSYLQTYLERDVRQLRQVGDLMDFQRFLQLLAAFNGQLLNLSSFARDLGVAVNTVKAWLSVLEASGQTFTVKPYYMNKGKRIVKSPKVYFLDTGLLCHLSGLTTVTQAFQGPGSGQFFETMVLGELVRHAYSQGFLPRVYFWRTSSGEEVDFVTEEAGRLIPIEVKLTSHITTRMAQSLRSFSSLFQEQVDEALLITLAGDALKIGEGVRTLPFADMIAG